MGLAAAFHGTVMIPATDMLGHEVGLPGTLVVPDVARGIVIFAHGAGSSRLSPRNTAVAAALREGGRFGTLLFDLLTEREDTDYRVRFDIELLTHRLLEATEWLLRQAEAEGRALGYFGASTGAAAALKAAARQPNQVGAIVSRGGRPDLADDELPSVRTPTLLIVGGNDPVVIDLNRAALQRITGPAEITIVPGATHLFEERGALEYVSVLARSWFERHLA